MDAWQRLTKAIFLSVLMVVLAIAPIGCGRLAPDTPPDASVLILPDVVSLSRPQLPDWIEEVSPIGDAEGLSQIRIRFAHPVIPLSSLDDPDRQEALSKFQLDPPLPGHFRFLTPRMVGFQPDRALPLASRVNIMLKQGLRDLDGQELEKDLAWTIETAPFSLKLLDNRQERNLQPKLVLQSSTPLDVKSLRDRITLHPKNQPERTLAIANFKESSLSSEKIPNAKFDPSRQPWSYELTPANKLEKDVTYVLQVETGVKPIFGNLKSDREFAFSFETYAPLELRSFTTKAISQREDGWTFREDLITREPQLIFNNSLNAESARKHVHITPTPGEDSKSLVSAIGRFVTVNPARLEPRTDYTISVDADLEDRYGQKLGKSQSFEFTSGDLRPALSFPSGFHIFPAGSDLQLHIDSLNLFDDTLRAIYLDITPDNLVDAFRTSGQVDAYHLLPNQRHQQNALTEWPTYALADAILNQTSETIVSVKDYLKQPTGMMAYGVTARTRRHTQDKNQTLYWSGPKAFGSIQLTNVGLYAQVFPDSGVVRAHHLSDGSAIANASIELYASPDSKTQPKTLDPCAVGQTDATGTLALSESDLQACMRGRTFSYGSGRSSLSLLAIAREGEDWSHAVIRSFSGSYGYGAYTSWDDGRPQSRGTILSDRDLYQPGEVLWLTGEAFYLQQDELKSDRGTEYALTLRDPKGNTTSLGSHRVNEFGSFSVKHQLLETQPLGYYSVEARAQNGVALYGGFRVAEFKPPNFNISLDVERSRAIAGDTLTTTTESSYLFGAPVQNGKVNYTITRRRQRNFSLPGWDGFSFGSTWSWPEQPPELSSDVLQTEAILDTEGKDELTIALDDDLPYAMTYRIDAEVSDVSNLSVSASQTIEVLPSDRSIGLKTGFVAEADEAVPVHFIVTDSEGKAISNQKVHLALQKRVYNRVTRSIEGAAVERPQVRYETVAEATARSGSDEQVVDLTPPKSGSYRIEATLAGSKTKALTHRSIWVSGAERTYWGDRYDQPRLEIALDRETYKPGDTATALIQSPYAEGELYFAVVRRDTLYSRIIPVKGGAPQVQFEVTPDMLPNASVQAVLVRQGEPLETADVAELADLSHIGFAPFDVSLDSKYLDLAIAPAKPSASPGGEQTLSVRVKDSNGQPTRSQVTLAVVNEAVLQLNGFRFPDLVQTVYAHQPIATRFADNRPAVALAPPPPLEEKGWGYGGGLSSASSNTRIRKDFRPLAYFNGSVITNENGEAEVTFALPDDLTTWRVLAIASTSDLRFGSTDTTFTATQPLLANPILPQFARLGDVFDIGVAVTNTTDTTGMLNIQAEVERDPQDVVPFDVPPLLMVPGDREVETHALESAMAEGTQSHRIQVVAAQVGRSLIRFRTQLGSLTDGFEVPLEVKALLPTEQTIETGVTAARVRIPLRVNENVVPNSGGLQIALASTLLPEIVAPIQSIAHYDELPFLEPAASRLAIAAHLRTLSQTYEQTFPNIDIEPLANTALKELSKLQRANGGFQHWPHSSQTSSVTGTAYAARSIAAARDAGLDTSAIDLDRLTRYLNDVLADPNKYQSSSRYCNETCKATRRLETLLALDALGDTRTDFLETILDVREDLNLTNQFRLARYLSQFPAWQEVAKTLTQSLQENVTFTSRAAVVNNPQRHWYTPTVLQAEVLRLAVARNDNPETIARSVRGLLDMRRNGIWRWGSYTNAIAIEALLDYAQRQPDPPNFTARVRLDSNELAATQFRGYQNPSLDLHVPIHELPQGDRTLTLEKSGTGELHYLAAYQYRLPDAQPGRFEGLRVIRSIRPAGENDILQTMDLTPSDRPLTLQPGRVFDVEVSIIADRPVERVVITDPLPAGFEPVDTQFRTNATNLRESRDSWGIRYQSLHRDRVVAYADRLSAGAYSLHYLVRSVTPGTFLWPGATAKIQYEPETFGRTSAEFIRIREDL